MKKYLISYELKEIPQRVEPHLDKSFKKNKMRIVNAVNQAEAWQKLHEFYKDKNDDQGSYYQITEIHFITEEIL